MEPADKTPNVLDMGSAKVLTSYVADKMTDLARNVSIAQDGFEFDIPDNVLFDRGTARPTAEFVTVMDRLQALTVGLEDANVIVVSNMFIQTVAGANPETAHRVAAERSDLMTKRVQSTLEHNSVSVTGNINVKDKKGEADPAKLIGLIHVSIKQKEFKSDGKAQRKLETLFGQPRADMSVYDNFVTQVTNRRTKQAAEKAEEKSTEENSTTEPGQ